MAHRADGAVPFGRARDVQRAGALLPRPGRTDSCGLIVGDPGIGKTTLARALVAQAEADGARVGWGVAGEWEGAFPLWPWFEAVTELDPQQDVLPSGVEPGSNGIAPVELMRSVALWLAGLAAAGPPVLIVLEDLHLADPTAVDLFAYLSRRPLPETVSVIGTARPGRDALDALTCRRIALSGLDEDAVAAMVSAAGRRLEPQALRSLVQRTGGNPLFVQRLLDSGLGDGVGDQPMPNDIAQLLRLQLDSAPPAARPLLDALSVLGSAGIDVLERMTDVFDARAVLAQTPSPLVVVDGDQVHFPHGLVRELLYDELLADDRFQLHARAADTIRDDAGPITVAHHLARAAATHRTFAAAEAAREAARIVRGMGALTEAVDHHRLAVSILRDLDAPAPLADATIDLAVSTAELGRVSDAEQLLNDVIDQARDCALDASIRRRLVREYGRLRWREEPNPSALDPNRLSRVARQWFAESSDPLDQAVVHTALVQVGEIRGIEPPDLVHGLRAITAAEHLDDPTVVAEAHLAFRRALMVHHDRLEDRRSTSEAGLRLARETRDGELIARARRLALTD
ncbi:MAG: AAA family ATPase, partial [Acidimicrobiales bacterium]|nr:AAA family ATPase [Acidimicrobiales bacterium]